MSLAGCARLCACADLFSDDLIGPPVLCVALFIAVLLNFIVRGECGRSALTEGPQAHRRAFSHSATIQRALSVSASRVYLFAALLECKTCVISPSCAAGAGVVCQDGVQDDLRAVRAGRGDAARQRSIVLDQVRRLARLRGSTTRVGCG